MPDPPKPRLFDQTERITARLSDLVRSYPKGLGLVKEFLQNADDSGASFLHVTYDRRNHPGRMSNHEQEVVLGPALLFTNDRTFSAQDIQSIQRIGGGGKLHEARGTGRFGHGFNTSFSISDHPTLLTSDWVIWFDPHHRAHGPERNAWAWSLEDVCQSWSAWAATFTPGGYSLGARHHNGAIFRLPLRSPAEADRSEIMAEAFKDPDWEAILHEARQLGPALLVFLRSVQMLLIDEIAPDGTRRERFRAETVNSAEVEAARSALRASVQGDPATLLARWTQSADPLPLAAYQQVFRLLVDGQPTEQTWAVITGLFRGPDNRLLKHAQAVCARNEKVLPWAGAAAPLVADTRIGGLACFLPLPEPAGWPVLLHGWFDVDSARRGITRQAGTGETAQYRASWNQELLRHGVGPAWAALVEQLRGDAATTTKPYQLWPQPSIAKDDYDRALVEGFYTDIGARVVFRCIGAGGPAWYSLQEMKQDFWDLGPTWHETLREPLLASGYMLVEPPMPSFAVQELQKTAHPAQVLSTDAIREIIRFDGDINCPLHDAPWAALRHPEWVTSFARFCIQEGTDKLAGLTLALLADGRLHTFGECGTIYIVTDNERELLADVPHRMLHLQFQHELELAQPVPMLGLKVLDLPGLVECVQETLSAGTILDEEWFVRLFDYLEQLPPHEVSKHRTAIQTLKLVPDQHGKRWHMGYMNTPVLLPERFPKPLETSLNRLGVPILAGSNRLIESIRRFASRQHRFVWTLSPNHLATAIAFDVQQPWINQQALADRTVVDEILDFLSPPEWLRENDPRRDALRRLPMLPTVDGSIVSAETKNLYVPGGFHPPPGLGVRYVLLDTGKDGRWAALFVALGIPECDGFYFVVSVLLPAFSRITPDVQLDVLRWLRDNIHSVEADLPQGKHEELRSRLRMSPILPLQGGGMGMPHQIYRPDAEEALNILGDVAKIPDLEFLGGVPNQWDDFFRFVGLLSTPQPAHLLQAVRRCVAIAQAQGATASRERLRELCEHIAERWKILAKPTKTGGSQSFADELAAMAWLPAAAPAQDRVLSAATWPDRLFKANELAAPRFLHLVASVHPVLDGTAIPTEMAEALGLRMEVSLDEVLRHFAAVRVLDVNGTTSQVQQAQRMAFAALLQYIAELPAERKSHWGPRLAELRDVPCVLLRGMWWRPQRAFLEALPFVTDWCVSFLEEPDVLGQPWGVRGLVRLGVRSRPESADWVKMLDEQHTRAAGRALSEAESAQVHAALQQLRVESREWLQSQPIRVLTADRQLLLAKNALLPDDPRLKRLPCLCPLPLVEETEVSLDIARQAGARSFRQVLVEELSDEPVPSDNPEMIHWAEQCTRVVGSPMFYEALRRLAWHDAASRGDEDPGASASDKRLLLARRLTVRVAHALRVTSAFRDTGDIVFEQQASSFCDQASAVLWLIEGGTRRMSDILARTIATECDLDALRISRLLEVQPEQMASVLDDDDVAVIPSGGQASLPPMWLASASPENEQEPTDTSHDKREADVDRVNEDPAVYSASAGAESRQYPSRSLGAGLPWRGRQGGPAPHGSGSAAGPHLGQSTSGSDAPLANGSSKATQPHKAPTTPGFGSSRPWSPDAPAPGQGGAWRLRSYVHREGLNDYDTGSAGSDWVHPINNEAVQRVLDWERARGRTPVGPFDGHQGYDIESSGPEQVRYISVIGIDGPWTARGVGLTRPEIRKASELGASWWLYVVEYARDPSRALVHDLRNPFLDAAEYRFDSGWRAVALAEKPARREPVEGEEITLEDGRQATVRGVEGRGRLWKVTIQFVDGNEETLVWRPSWRRG